MAETREQVLERELDIAKGQIEGLTKVYELAQQEKAVLQGRLLEMEVRLNATQSNLARVTECNKAMREPMRKLREAVGDFGSSESVVVDKVLARVAAGRGQS